MSSHLRPSTQTAPGIIERPRLLQKLRAVREYKLTLISAPPGYGKTTVAAQFARQSSYPVAWHTVEERERDVPNLHAQALAALSVIAPGIQQLPPTYGYTPGELASVIAEYLRTALPGDFIYILDDVQHLVGSPAAEAWVRSLVALAPPSCHLILISRALPDLPLAEMIARREVLAIGQQELRFTPQEVEDLAGEMLGSDGPRTDVEDLTTRLEGWPAGTVLALHPLPADLERAMLSGGEGPEALFDALAELMLRAQPPDLRDFLLASSTLLRLSPELCSAALQLPNSARQLAEAQNRSLFLSRIPGGLAYHRLFRTFLQQQLKASNPRLFASLHARAAHWFEERDQLEAAFDHFISAGLFERAAVLAERVAQAYFAQGKVETLLEWSDKLSQTSVQIPRLLHACACIHTDRYEYAPAEAELREAEAVFADQKDSSGISLVRLQQAYIDLQRGDYRQAVSLAEALARLPPGAANVRGRALRVLGIARIHLGELNAAVEHLEEALPLFRADGNAYTLANLLQDLEVAYTRSGRFTDAVACLQEVVALRRSLGSAGGLAAALNNLGYYYHQQSSYREAMTTYQEGLSIIARVPSRRVESALLWNLADLQRDRGAFDEADQLYNKALELIGNAEPFLHTVVLISASTHCRWQGNLDKALSLAEEAAALANRHNLALERITTQAAIWAARAQMDDPGLAVEHLEALAEQLRQQNNQIKLLQLLGLLAHAALLCGDSPHAEQALQLAMDVVQERGSAQTLAAEIWHTPQLAAFVMNEFPAHELLLRDLESLREAQVQPIYKAQPDSRRTADETYSLRVLTLGQEIIERDGQRIHSSEWRATTARELFLYLLFAGPQSREQISLIFWPDSSSRRVRSSFHTTLYRIRQALGENVITFDDGLYRINPDLDTWCDANELESLTLQARLLSPHDARTEDLWRRAVKLYRGEFLMALDTDWVLPRREAMQQAFIEALVGLGECKRVRKDIRGAIEAFKRAVDVDPYREDIHRSIMNCYAELGEKKHILAHLRELRELLFNDLAIEPAPETIALAETLLN